MPNAEVCVICEVGNAVEKIIPELPLKLGGRIVWLKNVRHFECRNCGRGYFNDEQSREYSYKVEQSKNL